MMYETFRDVEKYCFIVRSESVSSILKDEPETSNYHVADDDFRRFVDGLEKPLGEHHAPNALLMRQLNYAQGTDCWHRLPPVHSTLFTNYSWTRRQDIDDLPDNANGTLYLHEGGKPPAFGMEFSRNGRPFTGYFQEHSPGVTWNHDRWCVGAVTREGKLLLRESTPICVPELALLTVTIHRGHLRIVKHNNLLIYNDRPLRHVIRRQIDMASNKDEFERGIRTVTKLRMAAAEFWRSVRASVGDPSTCDVAPDDWIPLQEKLFCFLDARDFRYSLPHPFQRGIDLSVESRIGDEEFREFKDSPWTTGSRSVSIFAKYAFDDQPPSHFTKNIPFTHMGIIPLMQLENIPLTQLGLDPADPEYEPYNGYVPSNYFISVEEDDDFDYWTQEKLLAPAKSFADFAKTVIPLVKKKLPFEDNLVSFFAVVAKHELEIFLFYLAGSERRTVREFTQYFCLKNKDDFERGLRALNLVRKTAADIRRRLCADVAARRTGEIHLPAEPDRMEISRSEDGEISNVNDTMARIDLGAEPPSGDSAPVEVETNAASQRGRKRGRDEDEDEAPQTVKHRRIVKMMPQACLGADAGSVGPAAADTKANFASQDDRRRRQDEDQGETTGAKLELRTGGAGMSGGPAPVDMKAGPVSQDAQNTKQDGNKGETPQTVTTGTMKESQPDGGPAPLGMKANPASQDGQNRRRDEDESETSRTVTTGTMLETRPGSGDPAPVEKKANLSSKNGRKRRRDEEEDEVTHLTEKYRRLGVDSSSRRKV